MAAAAGAQPPAETFDQLRVLVESGDTLTITGGTGNRTENRSRACQDPRLC
jgi:hypothetical protein